jgi:NADP-dependent 3-hydroxy acid dehydrogenase YdfG
MKHSSITRILRTKTIVITGASSGVGRATALAFANYGAKLVLAARREDALKELVKACKEQGGLAIGVPTDVTDAEAMQNLATIANEFGGGIDVWFNNAGVLAAGPFETTPIEVHQQVIETNLLGYMKGAHAILPYFKNQQKGVLINNISVGGWFPVPYGVSYSASKFGLCGYSEA